MTTKIGKSMRLKRVIDPAGVSVICALDHGMTSPTFLEPLADIAARTRRDGGRRRERDHDEQGHDPDRRAGVLARRRRSRCCCRPPRTPAATGPRSCRSPRSRRRCVLGADAVVLFTALGGDTEAGMIDILAGGRARVRGARHAVHRRGRVPDHVRDRRGAEGAVRLRVPAAQRPPVRRARRRHREDELARRRRVVRASWSRRPTGSRWCSPAARGWRTRSCCGGWSRPSRAGAIGCSVGRNIFMHALARGDHPGALPGDPRAVERRSKALVEALGGEDELAERGVVAMRAAFMTDVNAVEVRETEEPKLDPRGAILRVEACGICGTDARTFFNGDPRAPAPWVLGHEPVGVLEEVGPEAVLPPGVAEGRPGVPRLDPHVRRVPVVHGGVPEPVRAPPAVRVRPVPRGVRRVGGGAADRDEEPDPAARRPAVAISRRSPTRSRAR